MIGLFVVDTKNVFIFVFFNVSENDKIQAFVQKNEEDIAKIVLGDKFIYGSSTENAKSWDINGEKVTLSVEKL